jgi:serine/threonine-protein kinase
VAPDRVPIPDGPVELEPWLADVGTVFAEIRGHDSGCTSYGVAVGDSRWFVKAAYGDDRWQLFSAIDVHARLRHPSVVPLAAEFPIEGDGHALVYPWVDGESLNDPSVAGSQPRTDPDSALTRFRALPLDDALAAFDDLLDAHVAAADAGLVAVDLYDGCLLYDFDNHHLHLVDLDLYRPPYRLELDRQFGSSRLMAPEELRRGSLVDERATVFTLARLARHLLCDPGGDEATFRAGPTRLEECDRATSTDPAGRHRDVRGFAVAWRSAAR